MKKIISLIMSIFLLSGCVSKKRDKGEEIVKDYIISQWYASQVLLREAYDYSNTECTEYSAPLNGYYLLPPFFPTFYSDKKNYTNAIIGDSTMAIAISYDGFYNASITKAVPVGGNTLCDLIMTTKPSIGNANPSVIIISTAGGNDLLHKTNNDKIIRSAEILFTKLKEYYPNAKLVVVGIHPSLVNYGNQNKGYVNTGIKNKLQSIYPSGQWCFVDPQSSFTGVTQEGDPAQPSDMLTNDNIHYNRNMTFTIKNLIQGQCGVTF